MIAFVAQWHHSKMKENEDKFEVAHGGLPPSVFIIHAGKEKWSLLTNFCRQIGALHLAAFDHYSYQENILHYQKSKVVLLYGYFLYALKFYDPIIK